MHSGWAPGPSAGRCLEGSERQASLFLLGALDGPVSSQSRSPLPLSHFTHETLGSLRDEVPRPGRIASQ